MRVKFQPENQDLDIIMDLKIENFMKVFFVIMVLFNLSSCMDKKSNTQVVLDTGNIIYCGWLPEMMRGDSCRMFKPENSIDFKCFKKDSDNFMNITTYDKLLASDQVFSNEVVLEYKFKKLKVRYPENKVSYKKIELKQIDGELVESIGDKKYWGEFSFSDNSNTIVFVYQSDSNSSSEFRRIINSFVQCQ